MKLFKGVGFVFVAVFLVISVLFINYNVKSKFYYSFVNPSYQCDDFNVSNYELSRIVHDTGSMNPYIFSGDYILHKPYNPDKELVVGDVLRVNGIVHRVSGVKYCDSLFKINKSCVDYFTMKGDNNFYIDENKYYVDDIDYVVCGVVRGGVYE
jgi:hypothetical protein